MPKKSNPFVVDTPDHLPKLHQFCIATGKRGSGKSVAITHLLRMYKEHFKDDMRCILVSPTAGSNHNLLSDLGIKSEDVFEEPDDDVPAKLNRIANDERDSFIDWQHLNEYYNEFVKGLTAGNFDRSEIQNEYMLNYYNPLTNQFERPKPKYKCYMKGRPPLLACFIDDAQGSKLLSTNK
jgi:tRNA(Met) C34 N-acetyltransferase TmcA